jgi:hypothetical protein
MELSPINSSQCKVVVNINHIRDDQIRITDLSTYRNSNISLYKYLIDNNTNDILLFFQCIGFTYRKYPGQNLLLYILIKIYVLISIILSIIGYISCMYGVNNVIKLRRNNIIPIWFELITILGLCIALNTQIFSIGLSIYHSRIHLSKQNHRTTENVKKICFKNTLIFFFSMQIFSIASLILYCTKGNNFGPNLNHFYINFSIGIMNIVLTSCLSIVLFFLLLSTTQIQEVQKVMLIESYNNNLTIESYIFLKNDINTYIYHSQFASNLLFLTAALNTIAYLLCIFSIFSSQNKELPDMLRIKVTDIIAYSGVLIKEIVFFVYLLYISSEINEINETLLSSLATTNWENDKDIKRLSLFAYILMNPIKFEILGIRIQKKNTTYAFITATCFTLIYFGAKIFYFYQILDK